MPYFCSLGAVLNLSSHFWWKENLFRNGFSLAFLWPKPVISCQHRVIYRSFNLYNKEYCGGMDHWDSYHWSYHHHWGIRDSLCWIHFICINIICVYIYMYINDHTCTSPYYSLRYNTALRLVYMNYHELPIYMYIRLISWWIDWWVDSKCWPSHIWRWWFGAKTVDA